MKDNNKPFSDQINVLIDSNNSSAFIARAINVSDTTVRKWRDGDSDPSRENLIKLSEKFKVNLLWLATGQGAKKKGDYETEEDEQRVAELSAKPYGKGATHTVNDIGKALRSSREKYELALEILDCKPSDKTELFVKTLVFSIEKNRTMSIENIIALIQALEPN